MLGERVSTLLVKSFEDIFDVTFTARLEEELDEIEEGKLPWREAVKEFWEKFVVDLDKAGDEMLSYKAGIPTGKKCEKCGQGELLERISRHGFFLGCSRYPDCDFIQDLSPELPEETSGEPKIEYCDNCGKEMAIKRGRFGTFLACTGYPDCKTTRRLVQGTRIAHQPDEPLDEKCTLCGNGLVKKHGRFGEFIGCSGYPKCKYTRPITWASNARSAMKANSCAVAAPARVAADARAFSMAARATRIAILRRRTCRSTSRAQSVGRRSSSRSAQDRHRSRLSQGRLRLGKAGPRSAAANTS